MSQLFPENRWAKARPADPHWIGAHVVGRNASQLFHERFHFIRTERAIQTEDERLRVRKRYKRRFNSLPAQVSPRLVDYGTRNHQRHVASGFFKCIGDSEQRSLSVERVENGLDDEKIDTAFEQGSRLIEISLAKLIERDRAKSRIIYVRRNGTRNRKRSH